MIIQKKENELVVITMTEEEYNEKKKCYEEMKITLDTLKKNYRRLAKKIKTE